MTLLMSWFVHVLNESACGERVIEFASIKILVDVEMEIYVANDDNVVMVD